MFSRTVLISLVAGLAAAYAAQAAPEKSSAMPYSPDEIAALLKAHASAAPIPELEHADLAALAAREPGKTLLKWAEATPNDGWPRTSYTLYRLFKKTGDRSGYEKQYFEKRELLTRAALVAWLTKDPAALDRVNDYLWSICDEATWVLPAHERPEPYYIDLFAAETGSDLAHVLLVLGPQLPDEVRQRVQQNIEERILRPYAEHADWYPWRDGHNNWTGVCAGSVGETFLLADTDPHRQANALAHVIQQLHNFIEHGFDSDGGCLEGVSYWNYGLSHFVTFAEDLRARTGGKIDLLAQPKLKAIARYPLVVAMGANAFASFADSHEETTLAPFLVARLAERTGETSLLGFAGAPTSWRFDGCLHNILWWDGNKPAAPKLTDAYLSVSGIAKRVGEIAGKPAVLIAKAGNNAEPHNHNDVGSFILHIGKTTYLCDPGAGLYSRDYFNHNRYKNIFCNSYGHSVPRIAGQLQPAGAKYRGKVELTPEKDIRITFQHAYKVPELKSAVRTLSLYSDGAGLTDAFQFGGKGAEVEEAFLTWLPVQVKAGKALLTGAHGVLELSAEGGAFKTESLRKECQANHKKGTLTRITVTYPAKPKITAHVKFTFKSK